jgi:hypothetical protein
MADELLVEDGQARNTGIRGSQPIRKYQVRLGYGLGRDLDGGGRQQFTGAEKLFHLRAVTARRQYRIHREPAIRTVGWISFQKRLEVPHYTFPCSSAIPGHPATIMNMLRTIQADD